VLELWGGKVESHPTPAPEPPTIVTDDGTGKHRYALIAVGPQGNRTASSQGIVANGRATLRWDSVPGGDAYVVVRDGKEITGPLRIEGSQKEWSDESPE
jgi:hypothetical protein